MPTVIDPEGGFIREEDAPPQHSWDMMSHVCELCGMQMKYFVETETPCKELPD